MVKNIISGRYTDKRITVGDWQCSDLEREYVNEVLDSGRLSYGPFSRRFEQEFSRRHGCGYGVLSNSGTSSLQVALQTMKELHNWPDGAAVIVPSVTFVATVNVVLHNNLTPILVDIEPDYYGMDVGELESLLYAVKPHAPEPVAAIPVSLFGMPCALKDIQYLCNKRDVKVIHDSCGCMDVLHAYAFCGKWADITCYSMYMAHILPDGR